MLHLRFDEEISNRHSSVSIFVNGKNIGRLKLAPAEAIWLDHILEKGCEALSFEFIASGKGPDCDPAEIDACAKALATK